MRYVRQRRLSEAAKELATGADDILSLSLDFGYGSHEAFSRAFKEEFQLTPERVRAQGHVRNLKLVEAIAMDTSPTPKLDEPRLEHLLVKRMAGIIERYPCNAPGGIPDQWQRFQKYLGVSPSQIGKDAYGICCNFDHKGSFDYMTAFEISEMNGTIPIGLVEMSLPNQKYAVFRHLGHIANIRAVISAIWSEGLPASGLEPSHGPTLEKYGPEFNSQTGLGGFEIWISVK
jgi:AraC family transcriptional regulator